MLCFLTEMLATAKKYWKVRSGSSINLISTSKSDLKKKKKFFYHKLKLTQTSNFVIISAKLWLFEFLKQPARLELDELALLVLCGYKHLTDGPCGVCRFFKLFYFIPCLLWQKAIPLAFAVVPLFISLWNCIREIRPLCL